EDEDFAYYIAIDGTGGAAERILDLAEQLQLKDVLTPDGLAICGARLEEARSPGVQRDLSLRHGHEIEELGGLGHDEEPAEVALGLGRNVGDLVPTTVGVEVLQQALDFFGRRVRQR